MAVAGAISTPISSASTITNSKLNPRIETIHVQKTLIRVQFSNTYSPPPLSTFSNPYSTFKFKVERSLVPTHSSPKASASVSASASSSSSSVGSSEYIVEPATEEKFQTTLSLPGCSNIMFLLGTGYREKVFAIIGVKVYAAGFYVSESVIEKLNAWKGQQAAQIQGNSSLYDSIYQAPAEKSLQIVLVRDVDGKTFWGALDEAISPRIKVTTPGDESALSTFRSIFQGRPLKKGTLIFLTWLEPSKMQVCISADGLPSTVDATIKSLNVTSALFDVFFGGSPVSPSLKASVSNGLAAVLY